MITENLSTLKINKLSQEQYDKALNEGKINPNEIYLTPDEPIVKYKPFKNGDTITVENNTIYIGNEDINDLEVLYPNEHFICSFIFTVGDITQGSIDFVSSSYVGKAPDFKQGEIWELNILDRIVASGKVVSE